MAETAQDLSPGVRYQLEVNGQVVEEFNAPARHNVSIEGLGGTDVFLSKLPGNLETAADPYATRPPAPAGLYTTEAGEPIAWTFSDFVAKVKAPGTYYGRYPAIAASLRIEVDMDTRS